MKLGQRLLVAGVLLGLAGPGCGNGGSQTAVRVVVDGKNLTLTEQAAVRSIWLFVVGDGDGGTIPRMYSTTGLHGQYVAVYKPHITAGALDITVTINDKDGNVLGTRVTKAIILRGNEVVAMVSFGAGTEDDGGVSPPPPDGGDGGRDDGAGADGAVVDAPALDLSASDAPGDDGAVADVGGGDGAIACSAQACNGVTADSCCPAGCTALTDLDCVGCGNGHLDPGETCDPLDSCATACPAVGCQLFSLTGAGTCQAACVAAGMQTMCMNGDGCCPAGCTSTNDTDCNAMCGNGAVEGAELCDGNCPSKCPAMGCQLRTLQGSATTCNAQCVNGGMQTTCANGDGCCPTGCTATTDSDCAVTCGNGKLDPGETCDGNCPTSCPAMGCTLRMLLGTASACNVSCVDAPSPQMACVNGDACCPTGCNNTNDNNCAPRCGNSVVEMGETCDPQSACTTAMTGCVNNANTIVTMSGSPAQCTFACTRKQRTCGPMDTYCPTNVTCGPTMDADCAGCGNSRVEAGETCDPPSACVTQMAACVSDKDNVRTSSGSTAACTYKCTTTPRVCGGASDGFCPSGCGPTTDVDCPGCGNGKVETALGETCDTALSGSCPTSCPTTGCAPQQLTNAGTCTAACVAAPPPVCNATKADGCCPSTCDAVSDSDCTPKNDTCATAIDISPGGDFKFNLTMAKQDIPPGCTADTTNGKAEVVYTFKLADPSAVYLDVYEGGAAVNAALELYSETCPPNSKFVGCDIGSGQTDCKTSGAAWPRMFQPGLPAGTYFVVVRALGTANGVHTLRFQRVPTACISGGPLPTAAMTENCSDFNRYAPPTSCSPTTSSDNGFYFEKCPSVGLAVNTCGGRTAVSDTVLLLASGSLDFVNQGSCVPAASGAFLECNNDAGTACGLDANGGAITPKASFIADGARSARGIVSVVVDSIPIAGAASCIFTLSSSTVP